MSYEFHCPSCGKKLFSYEQRTRKYGCIIKECKKCGAEYADPRYVELAIEGIPEDELKIGPYLFMMIIGILLIWRAVHMFGVHQLGVMQQMQCLMPSVFLIFGIAAIIGSVISIILIKTGKRAQKLEVLFMESKERMRDMRYVSKLRNFGYDVPQEFGGFDL